MNDFAWEWGDVPRVVLDTVPEEAAGWKVRAYTSAGGVVVRDGQVLLLRRENGEVRLPKGHVEDDETIAECALREVREETGLRHPLLVRPLGVVENRFAHNHKRFERDEHWCLMTATTLEMDEPEAQWTPTWYPLAAAETALTFEAERIVLRWARAACGDE